MNRLPKWCDGIPWNLATITQNFWATVCLILFNTEHVRTCQCKTFGGGGAQCLSGHTVYILTSVGNLPSVL